MVPITPQDFGAVGDGVHDDADAFQAAINSFGQANPQNDAKGGFLWIPPGIYYFGKQVIINHAIVMQGSGSGNLHGSGSIILAAPGITPLKVVTEGQASILRDFHVQCFDPQGGSSITTTIALGGYVPANNCFPAKIQVVDVSSFNVGQMIKIEAAGDYGRHYAISATCYNNGIVAVVGDVCNQFLTSAQADGTYVGQTIQVGTYGLFTVIARTTHGAAQLLTVAQTYTAVVNKLTGQTFGSVAPMIFEILAVDPVTNTLNVENCNNPAASAGIISRGGTTDGLVVSHADSGILIKAKCMIQNVHAGMNGGGHVAGYSWYPFFKGAGFVVRGDHTDYNALGETGKNNSITNANAGSFSHCTAYGNYFGLFISGTDTNAMSIVVLDVSIQINYGIMDASSYGNKYFGTATSGGFGIRTRDNRNQDVVLIGAYTETGTFNCLGAGVTKIGGTGYHEGGSQFTAYGTDGVSFAGRTQFGINAGASKISDYQLSMFGNDYNSSLMAWSINSVANGVGSEMKFRRSTQYDGDLDSQKWWGPFPDDNPAVVPYLHSDKDSTVGNGFFWTPRGIFLGGTGGKLAGSSRRLYTAGTAIPTTGAHKGGDVVFNIAPTVQGTAGVGIGLYVVTGWMCIAAGTPGVWTEMRTPCSG